MKLSLLYKTIGGIHTHNAVLWYSFAVYADDIAVKKNLTTPRSSLCGFRKTEEQCPTMMRSLAFIVAGAQTTTIF